jgi:hypothetical protein
MQQIAAPMNLVILGSTQGPSDLPSLARGETVGMTISFLLFVMRLDSHF